ncbi:MAG: rhamnogalacturonan acetylesterase, partial [Bacteroidetes bacterium]|nr:rhamnogalacturonan acetylesterase [Bacteroidota bacterium]
SARHTDATTSFRDNMARYVEEVRRRNAYPILFTSIVRRNFDAQGHLKDTHGDYVTVVRRLAGELHVPLVDLNASMGRMVDSLGPEPAKKLYMYVEPGVTSLLPEGKKDDTHLCEYGARQVAALAARGIAELQLPLSAEIVLNNSK